MGRKPKTEWHAPFTILVDTREQKPFEFSGLRTDKKGGTLPIIVKTELTRLETGDYSIAGEENIICVERKSAEDLIKTLTRRRNEFFDEIRRMHSFKHSIIVVEESFGAVIDLVPTISQASAKSIGRTILAIQQDHPMVQWAFMPKRDIAMRYTFQYLKRYFERKDRHAEEAWLSQEMQMSSESSTLGEGDVQAMLLQNKEMDS